MRANKLVMILLLLGVTFLFLGEGVSAYEVHLKLGENTNACDDNTLTLMNVNRIGTVVVDVAGVSGTITQGSTKTVNGLGIYNEKGYYEREKEKRSADLDIDYGAYKLKVGQTKNGVKLINVGSNGQVVVDVDGIQEIVPKCITETVNGVDITPIIGYYLEEDPEHRWVVLEINNINPEYRDGDAFYNPCGLEWQSESCSVTAPDWKWGFDQLTSDHPEIYLKNDFVVNGDDDNPITVGECYDMPCGEYKLCFDGLNTENYADYTIEFESDTDLSTANPVYFNEPTFHIEANGGGLLRLESDNIEGLFADTDTSDIWLHIDRALVFNVGVYYNDASLGIVRLAGYIDTTGMQDNTNFAKVVFGDTELLIEFDLNGQSGSTWDVDSLTITLDIIDNDANIQNGADDLTIALGHTEVEFNSLGSTREVAEADELKWSDEEFEYGGPGVSIGTKDEDHRMRSGIIIKDPKSNGASDEVRLQIPDTKVEALVSLKDKNNNILEDGQITLGNAIVGENEKDGLDGDYEISDKEYIDIKYDSPVIHTSLTAHNDDYGTGIYMEVGKGSIEYRYFNNEPLVAGDVINFLGEEITLSYVGEQGISIADEKYCSVENSGECVRYPSESLSCHEYEKSEYSSCAANKIWVIKSGAYNYINCKGTQSNCWKSNSQDGTTVQCSDDFLDDEIKCNQQPGCTWAIETEAEVFAPGTSSGNSAMSIFIAVLAVAFIGGYWYYSKNKGRSKRRRRRR